MLRPIDPVVESDLLAYVDDQLDIARRIEVEDHLARNPALAAQVMADMRTRDELRLALPAPVGRGPARTMEAAARLERAFRRDRFLLPFRRAAAVILLIGAGWIAHSQFGPFVVSTSEASTPPPAFVAEAVMSHRTAVIRSEMHSQHASADLDAAEIRAKTAITLPSLPPEWRILDVEVFPSRNGPSIEVAVDAGGAIGRLSLFAVRPGGFDVLSPATAQYDGETVAYWQIGEVAYALVARGPGNDMAEAAATLSRSLY